MCNDFGNNVPYTDYVEAFSRLKIPLRFPSGAPNLEPREDIRPTDPAPVIRAAADGEGAELVELRWGFAPPRPKAGPVINFRSEGRRFGSGRCLAPASHFFEFTGTKYPKTKWRFTRVGAPWFCLAGLWRREEGPEGPQERFTLLTCAPGPDVEPYHDRQVAVIEPADWALWLDPSRAAEELLRPSPARTFAVAPAAPSG